MDVRIQNVSFSYDRKQKILDGVSFTAPEAEITAVVGANGAGKTTLVKSIMGLLNPDGDVYLGERKRRDIPLVELSKEIGYLTQESTIQASLSVFEVIMLGRMHHLGIRLDESEINQVWNLMRTLKIENLADKYYNELSGGQRRVVNIAQTIVKNPKVLILDEPTANLDLQNEIEMMELVRSYTDEKKTATIIILHDLNMASRFADHIVLLKDGKVFREGKPLEVINENSVRQAYGVNTKMLMADEDTPFLHVINSVRSTDYHFVEGKNHDNGHDGKN